MSRLHGCWPKWQILWPAVPTALFVQLYRDLADDRRVTIVPPAQDLFDEGIELYAQCPDKDWSLIDCISFVVMREYNLTDALTADRHFEQAGFRVLLERRDKQ